MSILSEALESIKRYGTPERWLMHPELACTLDYMHVTYTRQQNAEVLFVGVPIFVDWMEPSGISMEVLVLRSLWDILP